MKHRKLAVFLAVWMVISLSGCTYIGLDTQTLISPPKANTDQQEIHQLLQGDNADLIFVYPKTGEYSSAIIMEDFTGNGQEDALGFTWIDTGVEVQFLVKENGGWRILESFNNSATQVDRVYFGDFDGNGQQDVLIGWGNSQSVSATLGAYRYEAGGMTEILFDAKYDEMILTDFNEDSIPEIFLIQKAMVSQDDTTETVPGYAELFTIADGTVQSISRTEASNAVTKFSGITFGAVNQYMLGVVVDGAWSDGSMYTQVFYLNEEERLRSVPESPNDPEVVNPFYSPSGSSFTAADINMDGIIELPIARRLPAISDEVTLDSTSFLVEWSDLSMQNETGYISVLSAFMNTTEGYWFSTPNWLKSEITALNDPDTRTVTYHKVRAAENAQGETEYSLGSRIFSIRVFSKAGWDERSQTSQYEILLEWDEQIYALAIHTREIKYVQAIDKVKETFTLMNEW